MTFVIRLNQDVADAAWTSDVVRQIARIPVEQLPQVNWSGRVSEASCRRALAMLVLREGGGWSYARIALQFGLSVERVRQIVVRTQSTREHRPYRFPAIEKPKASRAREQPMPEWLASILNDGPRRRR